MSKFTFRKALLTGAASVLMVSSPAFAQEAQTFDIEAQPLAKALLEFSEQSGVTVAVQSPLVQGKSARPVKGAFEPEEALRQLLRGSGLKLTTTASGGYAITKANGQGGPGDAGDPVVVSGKITDQRTGSNLKGASVTIEETGQTVATDDLGNYRFPSVRPGTYSLRISYLGYQEIFTSITVGAGRPLNRSFQLVGGVEGREIVVYGNRSARAQALNQERTAENSTTVISSDLLGNFGATTVSEALRRAGGIALVPEDRTGDGANVIVRGLDPDLNQITINGVRLPDTSGFGRSPSLNSILADSIDSVTINKTLMPNQDSSGTGGLIEIETKSPLDRDRRFASFGLEYTDLAGSFGNDFLATGLISGKFGANDDFGLSLSVQYRERETNNLSYTSNLEFGRYFPAGITSLNQLDPTTERFPFEPGVDNAYVRGAFINETELDERNLTYTLSAQKRIGTHTDLRLDFTQVNLEQDFFDKSSETFVFSIRKQLAVPELGGEIRSVFSSEDLFPPFIVGIGPPPSLSYNGVDGRQNKTSTLSFRGETNTGDWQFKYGAGYARGRDVAPIQYFGQARLQSSLISSIPRELLSPEILANEIGGNIASVFLPISPNSGNIFPSRGFTQEGNSLYSDPANYRLSSGSLTGFEGQTERWSGNLSAKKSFSGGILNSIDVGVSFDDARFTDFTNDRETFFRQTVGGLPDIGLSLVPNGLERLGLPASGYAQLSRNGILELSQMVADMGPGTTPNLQITEIINRPELRERFTAEREIAPYLQARFDIGKLEIIGGVRVSILDVESAFFSSPTFADVNGTSDPTYADRFGQIVTGAVSRTDILPRILLNYRTSDNLVFRAGYYSTVARPKISQLTSNQQAGLDLRPMFGPDGDQPSLIVNQGNPALKPSFSHNFDASVEWYSDDVGVVKLSAFYNFIENPLFFNNFFGSLGNADELDLPDTPEFNALPANLFVQINQPQNGEEAIKSWGLEFAVERQFSFLPGFWSGFGAFANYTYSDSSSVRRLSFAGSPDGFVEAKYPLLGQAKHTGTAALTYNAHGIDASLAYSYQSRRLAQVRGYGLDAYNAAIDTLDLQLSYTPKIFDERIRITFEGTDLARGASTPSVQTFRGGQGETPKYYFGGRWFGGRKLKLGVSVNF